MLEDAMGFVLIHPADGETDVGQHVIAHRRLRDEGEIHLAHHAAEVHGAGTGEGLVSGDALDASQPKISRHLAQLRACELLHTRRQGQWIHYRLNEELPDWALTVIGELTAALPDSERAALSCCG